MWRQVKSDQVVRHLKPRVLHRVIGDACSEPILAGYAANSRLDYGVVKYRSFLP